MQKVIGTDAAETCLGWLCNKMSTRYGTIWDKNLQDKVNAKMIRKTWLTVLARMPRGHILVAMKLLYSIDNTQYKTYPPSAFQFEALPLEYALNELPALIEIQTMIARKKYVYIAIQETAQRPGMENLKLLSYERSLYILKEIYTRVMSNRVKTLEIEQVVARLDDSKK